MEEEKILLSQNNLSIKILAGFIGPMYCLIISNTRAPFSLDNWPFFLLLIFWTVIMWVLFTMRHPVYFDKHQMQFGSLNNPQFISYAQIKKISVQQGRGNYAYRCTVNYINNAGSPKKLRMQVRKGEYYPFPVFRILEEHIQHAKPAFRIEDIHRHHLPVID